MIAVDVDDITELHAAGIRALNEALGPDAARAFMSLSFGGYGDSVKEKYERPDMTDAELDAYLKKLKAGTEARMAQGPA